MARSGAGGVFTELTPDVFGRIEFRRAGREPIGLNAGVTVQECLYAKPTVNRMSIPDQNDGPVHKTQQLLEKSDGLLTAQGAPVRVQVQLELATARAQAQGTDQIEALAVFDARANRGRLAAWCPGALERRHARKAAFIDENQRGTPFTPLFLSLTSHHAASEPPLPHHVRKGDVGVSGNSSRWHVADATRRWGGSAQRTTPRSHARCGPVSSTLRRSQTRMHRVARHVPSAAVERPIAGADVRAAVDSSCGRAVALRLASPATLRSVSQTHCATCFAVCPCASSSSARSRRLLSCALVP